MSKLNCKILCINFFSQRRKKMTCMFLTKKFLRQIFLVIPGLFFWRLLFHYFKIVTVNCLTCIIAIELLLNSNKVYKNTKITKKIYATMCLFEKWPKTALPAPHFWSSTFVWYFNVIVKYSFTFYDLVSYRCAHYLTGSERPNPVRKNVNQFFSIRQQSRRRKL